MIRRASKDDIPSLLDLQKSIEEEDSIWGYGTDSEKVWSDRDLSWTYIAILRGRTVGFIYGQPRPFAGECVFTNQSKILEIADSVIAESYRSQGLGRELVGTLKANAIKDGFTHFRVYSAAKRFDDILAFYQSCGFTPWTLEMTQEIQTK